MCVCVCVCVCVYVWFRRKIRAKEKRERRKPTQTVSQETYDQLLKSSGATVLAGKVTFTVLCSSVELSSCF